MLKYAPFSRRYSSAGRESCPLTVTKGKAVRFAFQPEWLSGIVIDDVTCGGGVAFVDGSERFTISHLEDKRMLVTLRF